MTEKMNDAEIKGTGRTGTSAQFSALGNRTMQDLSVLSSKSGYKGGVDFLHLSKTIGNFGLQKPLSETGVIQRLRVHLGTDRNLLGMMDEVPLPGESGASIAIEKNGTVGKMVRNHENIVFEGHGSKGIFTGWAIEQEDFSPELLAFVAYHLTLEPDNWNGKILLFGCSTGKLAVKVSREAFKLFRRPITVIGTLRDVSFLKREPGGHIQDTAYIMDETFNSGDDWRIRVEYMESVKMLAKPSDGFLISLLHMDYDLRELLKNVCTETGQLVRQGQLNTAIARANEPIRAINDFKTQVGEIVGQIAFDHSRFNQYSPDGENIRIGRELRAVCAYIEDLPIPAELETTAQAQEINDRIQEWIRMQQDIRDNCFNQLDCLYRALEKFVLDARKSASVLVDLFDHRFVKETRQYESGLLRLWKEEIT